MTKQIINCETGEVIERELTEEEIAQQIIDEQMIADAKAKDELVAKAKAALFEKLGITEEEAKLLLG